MLDQTAFDHDLRTTAELAAGAGGWSLDIATGQQFCSPGLCHLLELNPEDVSTGVLAWQRVLAPADAEAANQLIEQSIRDRTAFMAAYQAMLPGPAQRWIEVHGQASYDASGNPRRFSGYCIDITARRKSEEEYREIKERQSFLLKLSDALAPLSDPVRIQIEACRVLGQHLKANRVFYAEVDETGLNRAGPQYLDGVPPTGEVWHSRDFDPSLVERYKSGEVLTCDDIAKSSSLSSAQVAAYTAEGIVAWAAAPITKPGMPLGRLVIHRNKPGHWDKFEIELIKETAERVWPAVQRAKSQVALELTENIPVGTYTMLLSPGNSTATFSFLSKRFLEITGLNADEVRGDPMKAFTCLHPADYDLWIKKNEEAITKRLPFFGEGRIIARGETRWVRAESMPRAMPDGSTVWEGVLIDITDQRRAEEALQQSEERYRLVADITQEAWWEENLQTQRLTNSPRFCEILNRGEEILDCSTTAYRDLIHPDDRAHTFAAFTRSVDENADYKEVYRLRHADGHYVWVEDHARVIERDANGVATRMLGTIIDITARKNAELAMQESEENFRRLFDDAPDAYVIMDQKDLRILACNKGAARLLGGSREQIIGITPIQISPPYQPNGRPTGEAAREMIQGILNKGHHRFEWMHRRLDGEDFWVEVTATTGSFRQHPVFFVTWREIGEIIAAKQAAEAASIAKSQFLSVMSHELRTPLNAIMGLFQLIGMTGPGEKAREFAAKGLNSSEHLLALINDILDFSSIEAGRLTMVNTPFRLKALLDEVSQMAEGRRSVGVDLKVILDESLQTLDFMGDALRLKQVLINLVGNSIKFTEAGSVVLTVSRAGGPPEAPLLQFSVADTGIGMTPDQQSRLFQPFTQVDMTNVRRFSGTGLGLVISQRLVSLLGGEPIAVESRPGAGSRFSFRLALPLAGGLPATVPQLVPAISAPTAGRLGGYRVLVVEDDETTRFMLRLILEAEGAAVEEAVDGARGMAAALGATVPFDMVLMDMRMPNMDGLEAARELRARGYSRPILALTANAYGRDRDACFAAGMNDYITKPMKIDDLVRVLQRNRQA